MTIKPPAHLSNILDCLDKMNREMLEMWNNRGIYPGYAGRNELMQTCIDYCTDFNLWPEYRIPGQPITVSYFRAQDNAAASVYMAQNFSARCGYKLERKDYITSEWYEINWEQEYTDWFKKAAHLADDIKY